MSLPRIAIVFGGKNVLVGRALVAALTAAGVETIPVAASDVDYFDADALDEFLDRYDTVEDGQEDDDGSGLCLVNAVAYTQVDHGRGPG
jgi:dTDP-4-dehydrorhamnose reductase